MSSHNLTIDQAHTALYRIDPKIQIAKSGKTYRLCLLSAGRVAARATVTNCDDLPTLIDVAMQMKAPWPGRGSVSIRREAKQ